MSGLEDTEKKFNPASSQDTACVHDIKNICVTQGKKVSLLRPPAVRELCAFYLQLFWGYIAQELIVSPAPAASQFLSVQCSA
jgi:hypothetical protein